MFPIFAEPTLHRIRWADVDGDRKLELIVAPLHGKGAKGPDWDGPSARLLVLRPPANPRTEPWPMEVAGEANHIQHNFLDVQPRWRPAGGGHHGQQRGLARPEARPDGAWTRTLIGEGAPGEVKLGRVGGRSLLATVEPWHGAGLAIYAERAGVWSKTTIETALVEGPCAGLGRLRRRRQRRARGRLAGWPQAWRRHLRRDRDGALKAKTIVDDGGMATEDLMVGDFNGDKLPDIVASGRATRNIKIYWNETKPKKD